VRASRKSWLRYAGVGTFLLFLVKGLVWLSVPAVLAVRGCGTATTHEAGR
jgi:hypothetical protein